MSKLTKMMTLSLGLASALLLAQGARAQDVAAKRAELRKSCDAALATLYKAKPDTKAAVAKAAGYGCFTSFGMSFFVGGAGGKGLVHDNASKKEVYMNMAQASGGFDFGIKGYQEVLIFKDQATMKKFIDSGWEVSGTASAAAAASGSGGDVGPTQFGTAAIQAYPLTKTGLAAGFAVASRKYWKDDELNAAK